MDLLKHDQEILVVVAGRVEKATVQTGANVSGEPLGARRGVAYFILKHQGGLESRREDYADEGITWTRDVSREGAEALRAAYLLARSAVQPHQRHAADTVQRFRGGL